MRIYSIALVVVLLQLNACKHESNGDKIHDTMIKGLHYIQQNNSKKFKKMLYQNTPFDDERFAYNFMVANKLINKYHLNIDSPMIYYDINKKELDSSFLIHIPVFSGFDSSSGLTKAELKFYFGPPQFCPLSKLTRFYFDYDYDGNYREKAIENGKMKEDSF